MKLIVGILVAAFVLFLVAQVVFGPRAAVAIAGTVGGFLAGGPGAAVGIVFGLAALLVAGVLQVLLEGMGDEASGLAVSADASARAPRASESISVAAAYKTSVADAPRPVHAAYARDPKQERIGVAAPTMSSRDRPTVP